MTRFRVLITRPALDAERTARKVIALGHDPIVIPMRAIEWLNVRIPEGRFDLIAITSGNAAAALPSGFTERFAETPVVCVGSRTAAAVRDAGFRTVVEGGGTAGALAETIIAQGARRVLYLCGTPRRPDLEAALIAAGRDVTAVDTYRASDVTLNGEDRQRLTDGDWDIALLYSAESAATLGRCLADWTAQYLQAKRFLCLSEAVAKSLPAGARTEVAKEPGETALLDLIGPTS